MMYGVLKKGVHTLILLPCISHFNLTDLFLFSFFSSLLYCSILDYVFKMSQNSNVIAYSRLLPVHAYFNIIQTIT